MAGADNRQGVCVIGLGNMRSALAKALLAKGHAVTVWNRTLARRSWGKVPGIVYRTLATYQVRKAGYTRRTASTGAVTLIQNETRPDWLPASLDWRRGGNTIAGACR